MMHPGNAPPVAHVRLHIGPLGHNHHSPTAALRGLAGDVAALQLGVPPGAGGRRQRPQPPTSLRVLLGERRLPRPSGRARRRRQPSDPCQWEHKRAGGGGRDGGGGDGEHFVESALG